MCDPKPITLDEISFLNPVTIITEINITATESAIAKIAIRKIGYV